MTQEELEALPVGPCVRHERPITREDWAQGRRGRSVIWEEARAVRCNVYEPNDIIWFHDKEGRAWMFGQWADGAWFKQPSSLS